VRRPKEAGRGAYCGFFPASVGACPRQFHRLLGFAVFFDVEAADLVVLALALEAFAVFDDEVFGFAALAFDVLALEVLALEVLVLEVLALEVPDLPTAADFAEVLAAFFARDAAPAVVAVLDLVRAGLASGLVKSARPALAAALVTVVLTGPATSRRTARLAATLVISTAPSTTMSIRLSTSGIRLSEDLRGAAAALSWFGA
jgi:hypothetical protein